VIKQLKEFSAYTHKDPVTVEVSKRLVVINVVSGLVTHAFSLGVLVWLQRYLLQRISAEEYSLLPIVMAIIYILPLLTTFFTSGVSRYIVEAYSNRDEVRAIQILSSIIPFITVASLCIFVIGCYISLNIEYILNIPSGRNDEASLMVLLLLISFIVNFLIHPYTCGFDIRQQYVLRNLIATGIELLRIIVLFILLFTLGASVVWVVVASVSAGIIGAIINFIISRRLVPLLRFRVKSFNLRIAKEVLFFGLWSFLSQTADKIRTAADPIMLNLFATPLDVTTFHLGSVLKRQFDMIITKFLEPVQTALIAMYSRGESDRLRTIFYRLNKYVMWGGLLFVVPAIIYRSEIIRLYVGNKYIEASVVLALLFLPSIIATSLQLVWLIAPAIGKIKGLSIISITMQILNLSLTYILLVKYHMGSIGSALSTSIISSIALLFLILPLSLNLINGKFLEFLKYTFIPGILPAIAGSISWFILYILYNPYNIYSISLCSLIGLFIYSITLLFCLSDVDRKDLIKIYNIISNNFIRIKHRFPEHI